MLVLKLIYREWMIVNSVLLIIRPAQERMQSQIAFRNFDRSRKRYFPVPCLLAPKPQKGIVKGKKSTRF